jgi:hypothetical protein
MKLSLDLEVLSQLSLQRALQLCRVPRTGPEDDVAALQERLGIEEAETGTQIAQRCHGHAIVSGQVDRPEQGHVSGGLLRRARLFTRHHHLLPSITSTDLPRP